MNQIYIFACYFAWSICHYYWTWTNFYNWSNRIRLHQNSCELFIPLFPSVNIFPSFDLSVKLSTVLLLQHVLGFYHLICYFLYLPIYEMSSSSSLFIRFRDDMTSLSHLSLSTIMLVRVWPLKPVSSSIDVFRVKLGQPLRRGASGIQA